MIFFTDKDQDRLAYQLEDKRLISGIYYICMAISEAMRKNNRIGPWGDPGGSKDDILYISDWICQSRSNYVWAVELLEAFCDHYQNRFDTVHKAKRFIPWLKDNHNLFAFVDRELTEFPEPPVIDDIELEPRYSTIEAKYDDILEKLYYNDLSPESWWGYVTQEKRKC